MDDWNGKDRRQYTSEEFSPMQLWEMTFHPKDGAVPNMHKCLNKLSKQMTDLEASLKKYNGLHDVVHEIKDNVERQEQRCNETLMAHAKTSSYEQALHDAEQRGQVEAEKSFKRLSKVWGLITGTIAIIVTVAAFALNYIL